MDQQTQSKKQIKNGAIISYVSIFVNLSAILLYTPWMVKKIGQSNYALYTLATSFISLFLVDFGISSAVARFLAKYRAEGKDEKIAPFLGIVYKLFLYISLIIFVVLFVLYFFLDSIYTGLTQEEIESFKTVYIIVASFSIISFPFMPLDGVLNSHERFIELKIIGLANKLFSVFLIVISLICNLGLNGVVVSNVVAGIICILLKLIVIKKAKIPFPDFKCKDKTVLKAIFSFSIWVTVMSLAQRCMFNIAPSILGIVSNSTEIALFAPASCLEGYFFVFASAVNGLFLPKISRMIANGERDKIIDLMIKVGKFQMIVLGLIFTGFVVVGKEFMILWMGEEYKNAYYGAVILFIPDIFIFSNQIANTLMVVENKIKLQAYGYIIMAVTALSLSFVLSKTYGSMGACLAIGIGALVDYIYVNIVYKKVMKLDMGKFYKKCYLRTVPCIVLITALFLYLFKFFEKISWLLLFAKAVTITVVYLTVVFFIALNKEQRRIILSKVKNVLKKKSQESKVNNEE